MILKKDFLQALVGRKKFAYSTNVIESLWEKREKISSHQIARKKFLMVRNHPPPPPQMVGPLGNTVQKKVKNVTF